MQGNEDAQNEYLDVSRMNKKKKRKEHNEENKKLVIEQEREMKKLTRMLKLLKISFKQMKPLL